MSMLRRMESIVKRIDTTVAHIRMSVTIPRVNGSARMTGWRPGLKQRLMLLISVSIVLFCLASGKYIVARAQNDIRGEVYSATELIEHYLDAQMILARASWRANSEQVPQLQLARLNDVRHADVYFYNAVGTLLESSASAGKFKQSAPGWFVWLIQRSFTPIPDVRRFVTFDGFAVGLLIIRANPAFEMDEIWSFTRGLLGLLVAFALLVNVLVWWAVGRLSTPLERIRIALNELSAGRLDARLPAFDLPELASLGGDFNRMAQTLQHSKAENQRLTRRLLQVQEMERNRIARELHDEIGQCLTAVHADALAIHRTAAPSQPLIREGSAAIMDVTARIKAMVRDMLQRLRPTCLEDFGLEAALRDIEMGFRKRNPQTTCSLSIDAAANSMKGEQAQALYRVVQEAVTNVARHAEARHLKINISLVAAREPECNAVLRATLQDDGIGFDLSGPKEGYGLLGMRERITSLGGTIQIDTAPERGTRIQLDVPITTAEVA
jgi:two-component system sensor histidine kinase UhpB